jgi:hypothetical protein
MRFQLGLAAVFVIFSTFACGIMESSYENNDNGSNAKPAATGSGSTTGGSGSGSGSGGSTTGGSSGEDLGLKAFQTNIAPVLSSSCQSCHGAQTIGGGKLTGDATKDRTVMFNFTGCNAKKLNDKMDGTTSHGGGKLNSSMTATKVNAWIDAEPTCP